MAAKNKKARLVAAATASPRTPTPERLGDDQAGKKKNAWRVVCVSLYNPEAEWIDHATTALRQAGNAKANRSLVVREAILRLREEVQDKSPQELVHDFTQRQAKRTQAG
jgi:hypothetical protein